MSWSRDISIKVTAIQKNERYQTTRTITFDVIRTNTMPNEEYIRGLEDGIKLVGGFDEVKLSIETESGPNPEVSEP